MDLRKEKQSRIRYLFEIYKEAKKGSPISPSSVFFGLSRTRPYNMKTGEVGNNDSERGGYIIGEQLGLSRDEVDSIVVYFSGNEIGYMTATAGLKRFNITQRGIMYLESLEEEPAVVAQIQNNNFHIGSIHSPTQFQVGSNNSTQTQTTSYSHENVVELLNVLQSDMNSLKESIKEDLEAEIQYTLNQSKKGKDITQRLLNLGTLIKDIGINVFANLAAAPIYEIMKPHLGL